MLDLFRDALSNQVVLNGTQPTQTTTAPMPAPTDLTSLFKTVLSFSGLPDWALLIVIGSVIETLRRFASSTWRWLVEHLYIVATFEGDDDAYEWVMLWLSRQPTWRTGRELQVSARQLGPEQLTSTTKQLADKDDSRSLVERRKVSYLPAWDVARTIVYKRHLVRVTRLREKETYSQRGSESLEISILSPMGDHSILDSLLLDAKKAFDEEANGRVNIYVAGPYNEWRRAGSRPKRPLDSIVLDRGIKEMLLADTREFLSSEAWYGERGIPYRRGYLLYGSPGSGKTSLIQSLAGVLDLDVYIVNLAKRGLDDSGLNELICDMPPHAIALIEEIDAAFHRGTTRESTPQTPTPATTAQDPISPGVTLSGLLAAMDGISAAEGRILFATTNKYLSLDPALTRPGRLDIHVKFELATRAQAEELFKCFYPAQDSTSGTSEPAESATPTAVDADEKAALKPDVLTAAGNTPFTSPLVMPKFSRATIDLLASRFAEIIPEKEFSMAALQGLLMGFKRSPARAVEEAPQWIESERRKKAERERDLELAKATSATPAAADTAAQPSEKVPTTDDSKEEDTS